MDMDALKSWLRDRPAAAKFSVVRDQTSGWWDVGEFIGTEMVSQVAAGMHLHVAHTLAGLLNETRKGMGDELSAG